MATLDVVVIGGCGHVGLPLALALADRGLDVCAYDINAAAVASVNDGEMPFLEPGAPGVLARVLDSGRFRASAEAATISSAENIIMVIGTQVDEHLNPDLGNVQKALESLAANFVDGQLLVLRSTVYPGVTALIERMIDRLDVDIDVAFCPERIAEGKALVELYELPQIVSSRSPRALDRASKLFRNLTDEIVLLEPEEAELAKLFTNVWRYIRFATANQLYMMANDFGLDYEKIRRALSHNYPRAAELPGAGFTAGPCLFKDTMQLAAFNNNNFPLGQAAVMVNEGLPLYMVARLEQHHDLASMTVGILGMAFKGESDDIRSSLAYKLKRILRFKAERVLTHDPFVTVDSELDPLAKVLAESDLLIIAAPHAMYRDVEATAQIIDIWDLRTGGVQI